jgi:hypothetical protein
MFIDYSVEIHGVCPVLMHNGRLTDNTDPFTKELKRYTSKRTKSDEDHETMGTIEWCGGLYHSGTATVCGGEVEFSKDARVILPADNIWACLVEGAKVHKLGTEFKAAMLCDRDGEFSYDGPSDINELMRDKRFVHRKRAGIKASAVMRTRPVFPWWKAKFAVSIDESQLNEEQLVQAIQDAGRIKAIGDWTPRYGRFALASCKRVASN